jgi:hypothetical protein
MIDAKTTGSIPSDGIDTSQDHRWADYLRDPVRFQKWQTKSMRKC